jgi:hemolysin III
MFDLKKVPIPNYSRTEDMVNSITHAPGAVFAIVAMIMCFKKAGPDRTGVQTAAFIIYGVCMFILYFGSAYYHGRHPGFVKQVARVIDHSNVFLMITGTLSAYYLLGVMPVKYGIGLALFILSWVITAVGILLTFMDQERFKKIQMVMYLVLGWSAAFVLKSVWTLKDNGREFVLYILIGGIVYTDGAILYGIGKKVPYIHAVFHIFILAGTILQFCGIYLYAI